MVALDMVYEPEVIVLAAGMAFWGCFTAVSLMEQYRLSTIRDNRNSSLILLAFVAATLGGVAIWSLHFVATCSFRLRLNGVDIPLRYNVDLIVCALVVNIVIQYISIYIGSTDSCFNKSKKEIMESFISRARNAYTIAQIRNIGKYKLLFLLCTHNLHRIVFGGCLSGVGCIIVIYLGFLSMEFQGTVKYNPGLVVLTIIFACFFATNAFVAFARILSIFPSMDSMRLGIAFNSLFFMTGYHYIALTSVTFEYDSTKPVPSADTTVSQDKLLVGTLAAAVLFCVLMQIFVVSDLRSWLLTTSAQLRQADVVIGGLYQQTRTLERNAAHNEMIRYVRRFNRLAPTMDAVSADNSGETAPYMRRSSLYNDYSDDEEVSGTTLPCSVHADAAMAPVLYQRKKPERPEPTSNTGGSGATRSAVYITSEEPALNEHNQPTIHLNTSPNETENRENVYNKGSSAEP